MKSPVRGVFGTLLSWLPISLLWGAACAAPIRILPLGDSLTAGQASSETIGAYRPELARILAESGYQVDYLGTLHDEVNPALPDADHQGVNSARCDQLLSGLDGWLDVLPDPDVVLVLAGTNDFWQGGDLATVLARYEALIRSVSSRCPCARVIAATLPPRTDQAVLESLQSTFNDSLVGLVAALRADGISVSLADLHRALLPEHLTADGVHPDATGYQQIGRAWSAAVSQVILPYGTNDPPEVLRVVADPDLNGVTVQFSKPVSASSLMECRVETPPGHETVLRSVGLDQRSLHVSLNPPLLPGEKHAFGMSGVLDQAPEPHVMAAGTVATVTTSAVENGGFERDGAWVLEGHVGPNGDGVYRPAEGVRLLAFNSGQLSPNGIASQTIATIPGQDYQISFDYGVLGYLRSTQALRFIAMGNAVLQESLLQLSSPGSGECQWSRFGQRITADSAAMTLMWRDESQSTSDIDALLDHVVMVPLLDDGMVNADFMQGMFGWEATGNVPVVVNSTPYASGDKEPVMVFNGGQSEVGASIVQTFPTRPGETYAIEGNVGAYGDQTASAPTLQVSLSGRRWSRVETVGVAAAGFAAPAWRSCCWVFTADSRLTSLRFADVSRTSHNVDLLLGGLRLRPATTRRLRLEMDGGDGSWVRMTPVDVSGTGLTAATQDLSYNQGTQVVLEAAGETSGGGFSHWMKNGVLYSVQRSISLRLDDDVTVKPVYLAGVPADCLQNGSFELGSSQWDLSGNAMMISAYPPYQSADGEHLLVFNGGQTTSNATVCQSLQTVAGGEYELRFRAGVLSFSGGMQQLRVSVDGGLPVMAEFSWSGPADGGISWNDAVFRFHADGETTRLTLQDVSRDGDVTDLLLDRLGLFRVEEAGGTDPPVVAHESPPRLDLTVGPAGMDLVIEVFAAGNYRVETSEDLSTWVPFRSVDAPGAGRHEIERGVPLERRRYYRVVWPSADSGP